MRQAGVIAAAGIVALQTMVERLAEDHQNARLLAEGLAKIPGIIIHPERVQTNIVLFEPPEAVEAGIFLQQLKEQGVLLSSMGGRTIRAVTHRMISRDDIKAGIEAVSSVVKSM
ncbi:MAG: beta-eliminating lyase-related protein, partial [Dehalococcoidales bacterium]|nr:beta-eliminating lyase-related protein [Dehalococcoidales bacterium]